MHHLMGWDVTTAMPTVAPVSRALALHAQRAIRVILCESWTPIPPQVSACKIAQKAFSVMHRTIYDVSSVDSLVWTATHCTTVSNVKLEPHFSVEFVIWIPPAQWIKRWICKLICRRELVLLGTQKMHPAGRCLPRRPDVSLKKMHLKLSIGIPPIQLHGHPGCTVSDAPGPAIPTAAPIEHMRCMRRALQMSWLLVCANVSPRTISHVQQRKIGLPIMDVWLRIPWKWFGHHWNWFYDILKIFQDIM